MGLGWPYSYPYRYPYPYRYRYPYTYPSTLAPTLTPSPEQVLTSPHVHGSMGFCVFAMLLFLMSFWESKKGQEALVLVGLQIVAFFAINPFLISLADW